MILKKKSFNHLSDGSVVKAWDQKVCSLCDLRFGPCGCLYDGHWRLIWSLTSGPVGLVEVCASWSGYPVKLKKKKSRPWSSFWGWTVMWAINIFMLSFLQFIRKFFSSVEKHGNYVEKYRTWNACICISFTIMYFQKSI